MADPKNTMMYAFDTYYREDLAKTVCLAFADWRDDTETEIFCEDRNISAAYESGSFYKRELPCIVSLLNKIELMPEDIIIVDGYVTLDNNSSLGLGGYLFNHLDCKYAVIGLAKNEYTAEDESRRLVYRGESKKPLYVTARGINVDEAAAKIKCMHGDHRIPTLLRKLDQLTRV